MTSKLPALTPLQKKQRDVLKRFGIAHPRKAVLAAHKVGIPVAAAAALLEKESGGQNIYGHDAGGYFAGHGAVTEANFQQFYRAVVEEGHQSNGVGPTQITYRGYFPEMRQQGLRAWEPYDNMRFGFHLLLNSYNASHKSWNAAGGLYNGGPSWRSNQAAVQYGVDLAHKVGVWEKRLPH